MFSLWMGWILSGAPVIRMLPQVVEIRKRLMGKEQDGSYRAERHKEQQHGCRPWT